MTIRKRKLVGAVLLIALVAAWAFVAMGVAQLLPIWGNTMAQIAYYAVAGFGWVLPAMPLVSWMSRPDPPR